MRRLFFLLVLSWLVYTETTSTAAAPSLRDAAPREIAVQASAQPDPDESAPAAHPFSMSAAQWQAWYESAKARGITTTDSVSEWIGQQFEQASKSSDATIRATTKRVYDLYEQAKAAGETTASTAAEWFMEDVRRMTSWEYHVEIATRFNDHLKTTQQMNELGKQGWECFAVTDGKLFFKRRNRSYLQHLPARDLLRLMPDMLNEGK